jgi:hypothetical protein
LYLIDQRPISCITPKVLQWTNSTILFIKNQKERSWQKKIKGEENTHSSSTRKEKTARPI